MKISVEVNKEEETVTYTACVSVGGRTEVHMETQLTLSVTKLLYYAKPYHLDHAIPLPAELTQKEVTLFEELFYYPVEYYASARRNHFCYNRIADTGYEYQSGRPYEVQWKPAERE
jgi:hypothetical protein